MLTHSSSRCPASKLIRTFDAAAVSSARAKPSINDNRVRIELPPTSNRFATGHRIRLDISSSNFPRFDINPNTGEAMGRHRRMIPAENTVYLDPKRPSRVILPIVPI